VTVIIVHYLVSNEQSFVKKLSGPFMVPQVICVRLSEFEVNCSALFAIYTIKMRSFVSDVFLAHR
jgi:hypothetical protein